MTARFRLLALFVICLSGAAHSQTRDIFIDITDYSGLTVQQGTNSLQFLVSLGLNAHAVINGVDQQIKCISGFYLISDTGDLKALGENQNNWTFYKTFQDLAGWSGFDDPMPIDPGSTWTFNFTRLNNAAITRCGLRVTVPVGSPQFVAFPCGVPEPGQWAGLVAAVGCVAALRRRSQTK